MPLPRHRVGTLARPASRQAARSLGWFVAAVCLLSSGLVEARSAGISGRSGKQDGTCGACHSGGAAPAVGLSGPDEVVAGQLQTFTLTLAGPDQSGGGLNVAVESGTLVVAPAEVAATRILNGELTHTSPREGADVEWTFDWVAPDEPGDYTIWAAALAANLDGATSGDAVGATTFTVTVLDGCPDADGDGWEDARCNPSVASGGGDCDDGEPAVSPDEAEVCDGVDQDCDGATDEDPSGLLCDDGDPCTTDTCSAGWCDYEHNARPCDDGDPCTGDDTCVDGACVGTLVAVCDDGNPCTVDTCAPGEGCVFTPADGDPCDDGIDCTGEDTCQGGFCVGTVGLCECDSDADCALLEDDNLCDGRLSCDLAQEPSVCMLDPDTIVQCDPTLGTECSVNTCEPVLGLCTLSPRADGTVCALNDSCVLGAECLAGECHGGVAVDCSDGNPCTEDVCEPVGGCLHHNVDAICDDGNACTQGDRCQGGECVGGPVRSCNDGNACTEDACDPIDGCVSTPVGGVICDDGDACTLGDHCEAGVCTHDRELDCDDDNACTEDLCDPAGGCMYGEPTIPCDDGDACTTGDVCHAGQCLAGQPTECDDANPCTDDSCVSETGCVNAPNSDTCDDGDACTMGDVCDERVCAPGAPRQCDDFDLCTEDSCDPIEGCVFTPRVACCVVDEDCEEGDRCVANACIGGALCAECRVDEDCGVEDDRCLEMTGGNYCGQLCGEGEDDCPDGFRCEEDIASVPQCFPEQGTCVCTSHHTQVCGEDGNVYWADACGVQEDMAFDCVGFECRDGACQFDDPVVDPPTPDTNGGDPTPTDAGGDDPGTDDGGGSGSCTATPTATPASPWALLLLALAVAVIRRRRRKATA